MNKILVTSIEQDFMKHPNKKIIVEIPAPNALVVEIEKEGECVTTSVYVALK